MRYIGKECLIGNLYLIGMGREFGAYSYKLVDTSLHREVTHLGIEQLGRGSRLEDVTENQRFLELCVARCVLRTLLATLHKVKGDIERIDI